MKGPHAAAGALTILAMTALCAGCAAAAPGTAQRNPPAPARTVDTTRPGARPGMQPGAYPAGRPCPPSAHLPQISGDGRTPDTAVAAWARIAYSVDTTCDASPHDALVRSAPLMTRGLAGLVQRQRPVKAPGADWNRLADHRAWTTVTTSPTGAERPDDTTVRARRGIRIHAAAHGRDHWTGTGIEAVVYCTLARPRAGAPWRVAELSIQPIA